MSRPIPYSVAITPFDVVADAFTTNYMDTSPHPRRSQHHVEVVP